MQPARRLQPRPPAGDRGSDPSLTDLAGLVDRGPDGGWGQADGMVALLSWDDLSHALGAGGADLGQAWLTLTSVGDGASLALVRGAVVEVTPSLVDEQGLHRHGFRRHAGRWLRAVEDAAAPRVVVHALRDLLGVAHPRVLRYTLRAPDASRMRLMFGPLREQRRTPAAVSPLEPGQGRSRHPCRRCGQAMVDPLSISRGYGPDCWDVVTGRQAAEPGR